MTQSKPGLFIDALADGAVLVMLDARRPGVVVPSTLKSQMDLKLTYGRKLSIPIPDLEIDGFGIKATLSFERVPSLTFVPWGAVWAIAPAEGPLAIFEADVPGEIEVVRIEGVRSGKEKAN